MPGYDYSLPGWYYVTICTKNRIECLGDVKNAIMILNRHGQIAEQQWLWLGQQYDYVNVDVFVVMSNHLHGVLNIRDVPVWTGRDLSIRARDRDDDGAKIKSLSELIGAFKTTSSKIIHQNGFIDFAWQRSFYDRIIADDNEYYRICQYIRDNPAKWWRDRNNTRKFE
ncbi:transposase [Patescibacteria group bacterium]